MGGLGDGPHSEGGSGDMHVGRPGLGAAEEAPKAAKEISTGESQVRRGKLGFPTVSFPGAKP